VISKFIGSNPTQRTEDVPPLHEAIDGTRAKLQKQLGTVPSVSEEPISWR
jgi:hypothetical protein